MVTLGMVALGSAKCEEPRSGHCPVLPIISCERPKATMIGDGLYDHGCRSEATRQPLASQVDEAAGALRALQRMEAGPWGPGGQGSLGDDPTSVTSFRGSGAGCQLGLENPPKVGPFRGKSSN